MKQIEYDKPRIASTIVLGIFLTIFLIVSLLLLPVTWSAINEAIEESQNNSDNAAGAVAASFVIAIFLGLGVALAIVAYAVILLGAGLCLIFTIKNRKSTLLPIRIISFVYDGLAGAIIVLAIVKILLLAVFKV